MSGRKSQPGKLTSWLVGSTVTRFQPTTPAAISSTSSTPVAAAVPPTVIDAGADARVGRGRAVGDGRMEGGLGRPRHRARPSRRRPRWVPPRSWKTFSLRTGFGMDLASLGEVALVVTRYRRPRSPGISSAPPPDGARPGGPAGDPWRAHGHPPAPPSHPPHAPAPAGKGAHAPRAPRHTHPPAPPPAGPGAPTLPPPPGGADGPAAPPRKTPPGTPGAALGGANGKPFLAPRPGALAAPRAPYRLSPPPQASLSSGDSPPVRAPRPPTPPRVEKPPDPVPPPLPRPGDGRGAGRPPTPGSVCPPLRRAPAVAASVATRRPTRGVMLTNRCPWPAPAHPAAGPALPPRGLRVVPLPPLRRRGRGLARACQRPSRPPVPAREPAPPASATPPARSPHAMRAPPLRSSRAPRARPSASSPRTLALSRSHRARRACGCARARCRP